MQALTVMMLEVLKFFYVIGGHNYGLAIIWLTVAVNVALYPLTLTSIQQMSANAKLQPKLQALQKKHKDEPQRLQKETMDLFKSEGVNPLGGCLPVLLKIPVFLALFWALQSKEFTTLIGTGASFLWMKDIAGVFPLYLFPNMMGGDPACVLPILIGVTMWLSQRSMPAMPGQNQMMMWAMPIFIVFISVPFAAGVQIYWVVSNLMGYLQQAYIMKNKV